MRNLKIIAVVVCLFIIPLVLAVTLEKRTIPAPGADEVVVTGVVNPSGQLVTDDGKSFYVEEDEAGKALVALNGKKVQVKGMVTGKEDEKIITVKSFRETT
ncbi:MAG TPA: hypothetical protein PL090_00170 [Syntrophales bacterium]|nr:hypothetical protein [Syntrophales bacterium]